METPNTRSRRKRELELSGSQEERSTVVWGRDDELLREFMAESSDSAIPLPSPTQKPRPLRATSSTASAHPRKRPCRVSRAASNPPGHLGVGSHRNTPPADDDHGKRLDALLDRFLDLSRPSSSSSASLSSRSTSSLSTPGTGSTTRIATRQPMAERSTNHRPAPLTATRSLSPTKSKASPALPDRRGTASVDSVKSATPAASSHRFRPPLLSTTAGARPPGVRSSPRRTAGLNPYASSSAVNRGAQTALPRVNISSGVPSRPGTKRGSTSPTKGQPVARIGLTTRQSSVKTSQTRQASAPPPPPPTTTRPVPEPHASSDGDTSIDSLDILFEGGGDEIESLLRAVDGHS